MIYPINMILWYYKKFSLFSADYSHKRRCYLKYLKNKGEDKMSKMPPSKNLAIFNTKFDSTAWNNGGYLDSQKSFTGHSSHLLRLQYFMLSLTSAVSTRESCSPSNSCGFMSRYAATLLALLDTSRLICHTPRNSRRNICAVTAPMPLNSCNLLAKSFVSEDWL